MAPAPASSGRSNRDRINRGGDRHANSALCTIVLVRMRHDERTRNYIARRTAEGMSSKDSMRALERFVARETYRHLVSTNSRNTTGSTRAGS
ncbi:transposase [Streptomyces sp. NPDC096538]|uniref:transposase n=1 Tax=Streptomyces sp. NPDC096538 TaxID=3155427 RepID=UPI00332BC066